jgi:prolipoprotein diacylglyceryltransferase
LSPSYHPWPMPAWVPAVPAFIPSPSNGTFHLGPIPIHVYGLLLAVGVVVGTLIAERRWQRWGHDRRDISDIIVVVVICGVVGARLYTALTDPSATTGIGSSSPRSGGAACRSGG